MLVLSPTFNAVLTLTRERFDAFLETCRSQGLTPTFDLRPYAFHDEDSVLDVECPRSERARPKIMVAFTVKSPLLGTFSHVYFQHAGIESFFWKRLQLHMEFPVALSVTADGQLELTVGTIEFAQGLTGITTTLPFKTATATDRDRRPRLSDGSFIARTVPELYAQTRHIRGRYREHVADLWSTLEDDYGGFEVQPGCWLHVGWQPRGTSFVVIDTTRFQVLDPDPAHRLDREGWCQVRLTPELAGNYGWLTRIEEHGRLDHDLLSEPLGRVIAPIGSSSPLKVGQLVPFAWERCAIL